MTSLARAIARRLESGVGAASIARAWEPIWSRLARVGRAPPGVIGVRGTTLGGSWRTPTAIAIARALGAGLVGHGYRGSAPTCRLVSADDDLAIVGDEAIVAARALDRVAIGPVDEAFALLGTSLAVADRALDRSIVVVDAERPFGSGRAPPFGDLRARLAPDLAVVDRLGGEVAIDAPLATFDLVIPELPARVAVVTAIARPGRFVRALARRGIEPTVRVELPDHGGAIDERVARGVDAVIATEKCAVTLPRAIGGVPVIAIGLELTLPRGFVDEVVRRRFAGSDRRRVVARRA